MKTGAQLTLTVVAAAVALYGGYWYGSQGGDHGGHAAITAVPGSEAGAGERRVLYYRNPMGLPDISPVPKKDSMGMDYIPVYEGEETSDVGAVTVSPARLQTLGVRTAPVERHALEEPIRLVGRVAVNERTLIDVAPRFEGWIERLHVNATGDPVRRGQPLFSVYSPELLSASEELKIAERLGRDTAGADPLAAAAAARLAEATRSRVTNWQMALPPGAQPAGGRFTFTSPANGVVLEMRAVAGMRFMPGEALYRIADLSKVWVLADVYERDLARIAPGQPATVTLDAFPGRSFAARVAYIYPTLEAATRTAPIRLELDNPDGLLRPGLFAHAEVDAGRAKPVLTVPRSALIDSGERQVVLLAEGEGRFRPQPVKVGQRGADRIEITEGVNDGDRVVVSANFLIDSESNLRAALAAFTASADDPEDTPPVYASTGTLEAIEADGQSITVTHPEIPELQWPAMTMDFDLASPDVVQGFAPGSAIRFEFEQRGPGEFAVTRIEAGGNAEGADAHRGH